MAKIHGSIRMDKHEQREGAVPELDFNRSTDVISSSRF